MKSKKPIFLTALVTFLVTAVILSVIFLLTVVRIVTMYRQPAYKLEQVQALVDEYFIYDYDKDKLIEAAAAGYADALNDPYTEYLDKEEMAAMQESYSGDYVGIGVEVFIDDDELITVISPFEGSPAAKADIRPGDKIVGVEGTNVNVYNYNEAISMIKGEAGKSVKLTIKRGEAVFDVTVERQPIVAATVKYEMLEGNIGYIHMSQFGEHTPEEFKNAIETLKEQGATSLIVDLRNNPGGMLETLVEVADYVLPEGDIITVRDKQGKEERHKSDAQYEDMPMCVLINRNSASASEAFAGAIADHGRGTLIGEKSFGKGVVQTVFELGDGTALKLTVAKYYTPNDVCIDQIGITPHIEVALDEEMQNMIVSNIPYEKDYQLQKAVEVLKNK
ncbi:MAG: S41 family peptidase [Clostridia bacterium]|nr:S41 family peptidase [Clostridia bacterium]